ncbi:MAG: DUF2203 family protein [Planctomycetota bacterium]|jgi:hypothetical protein|nr:hypothetical protein [Planctomycetota bacterium]MDP6519947.1 DUF2203 family protein [Planctomycetota bacterium]MDP6956213.1 DUF2203 family protein [Planctomycetota bacterium]
MNNYDQQDASRLIPLLNSIMQEISDRIQAIALTEANLREMDKDEKAGRPGQALAAALMNHRRELRQCRKEINRLGCVFDEDQPYRILIPGNDGQLSGGYAWQTGEASIETRTPDTSNR